MQIFSVEFGLDYKGEVVENTIATLTFEVETFADLLFQLEIGEKDGSTKQRLIDTLAEVEVDVKFDSFGFGNIYNQLGELVFDMDNPEAVQLTSLSPEGESVIEYEDDEEDDDEDESEETKTLH
jgi:hypothetical protein